MAQFELTTQAWIELLPAGGSTPQMLVLAYGEALVSLGAPDGAVSAIKLGGAAKASLLDGRILRVPAGIAIYARASTGTARVILGDAEAIGELLAALLSPLDGRVLISPVDGRILLKAV